MVRPVGNGSLEGLVGTQRRHPCYAGYARWVNGPPHRRREGSRPGAGQIAAVGGEVWPGPLQNSNLTLGQFSARKLCRKDTQWNA